MTKLACTPRGDYDVIIAGAGPAGSTCARICARQGLRTLLLDREAFPRDKPCAGAVSERALSYLDFPIPPALIEKDCCGVFVSHGAHSVAAMRASRYGVLVSRRGFDELLKQKAVECGALFRAPEPVTAVREEEDRVIVSTNEAEYSSRFLVGADGVHSLVGQTIRPRFSREELAVALVCAVSAPETEIESRLGRTLDIRFGVAPLGYGWLFPHAGSYSLGIAGLASRFQRPRDALAALARHYGLKVGTVRGHFIPFGGICRPVSRTRIFLAGDAAGFADPFHGEGIEYAILSGVLAGQVLVAALREKRSPADAAAGYQRLTDRRITKQLAISLRLTRLLDAYPGLFKRLFFDHPPALERYLGIPAGDIDYRGFQRWLIAHLVPLLVGSRRRS